MLGGGTWQTQNKVLPGSYINFVSASAISATLSDRGYAAVALPLEWGADNKVIEVTNEDFQKNSLKLFGYSYTDEKLKGIRDIFKNANTVYVYKLTSDGEVAKNDLCTALYSGTRGNNLKTVVSKNLDDDTLFDVKLMFDNLVVDSQTVAEAKDLQPNDYVKWSSGATLTETAGTPLTGGTTKEVTTAEHQKFLDAIESYAFNTMCCASDDEGVKKLYVAHNKRMRDEIGVKYQLVVHNLKADFEGVINVATSVVGDSEPAYGAVYWVTGASAGCAVNRSNLNKAYDGEYELDTALTQNELIKAIQNGELVFHKVGEDVRVLKDINSLTSFTEDKGQVFSSNQTIRVIDQVANDSAAIFNTKYLGQYPNDSAGRMSLWVDMVFLREELQRLRAIQGYSSEDTVITQGNSKGAVLLEETITPVHVMEQLYMTTVIA